MKFISKILLLMAELSNAEGSLRAIYYAYRELLFNMKATFCHLYNYYFNRNIRKYRKLNIGSGNDYKTGFLNVDFNSCADVFLDARNKFPFKDCTIEFIYSSHFIEHLDHHELMEHFKECRRMLSNGGVLRIAAPDFVAAMAGYLNRNQERLEIIKTRFPIKLDSIKGIDKDLICYMDYLNRGIHEYGEHKIIFDLEKLQNMLICCGFEKEKIHVSKFDKTIDLESRDYASIYIEAIK